MSQDSILGENITIPEGHLLLNENELSRAMYFIRSGKVRVFKTYHGRKVTLAMLGPGEVFGEMSFFDSKPRSASVEALTSLSLLVIKDGVGAQQLGKLPEWVSPVFKVMAARLREANAHLASLKSLAEFQKDTQGINRLASSMYTETRRFLNILKLFLAGNAAPMEHDDVRARLDNLVGPRMVRLDVFFKLLFVHHLLTLEGDVHTGHVRFNEQLNHDFEAYLDAEIASERYLLLTDSAYAVLGRIAEILELEKKQGAPLSREISRSQITSSGAHAGMVPSMYNEGIEFLVAQNVVKSNKDRSVVTFDPEKTLQFYSYQSFLKGLDDSALAIDYRDWKKE